MTTAQATRTYPGTVVTRWIGAVSAASTVLALISGRVGITALLLGLTAVFAVVPSPDPWLENRWTRWAGYPAAAAAVAGLFLALTAIGGDLEVKLAAWYLLNFAAIVTGLYVFTVRYGTKGAWRNG